MRDDGKVVIGCELETKTFDAQISQLTAKLEDMESDLATIDLSPDSSEYKQLEAEIEKVKNRIIQLQKQKQKASETPISQPSEISSLGSGLEKIIGKVKKWTLAVFGVRSAYMAIRQAMSIISQYDKQMATDIEYMKYAVAMVFKPIIEWIVNAVYKLMYYINYIAKAWFGVNLFANASAKNFAKANGNAQKLKKTLAGFDELNVLNDNKDGDGVGVPSFDLSKFKDVPIPKWVQWIADHKEEIIGLLEIFGIAFGVSKISGMISNLKLLGGALSSVSVIAAGIAITALCAKQVWDDAQRLKKEMEDIRTAGEKHWETYVKGQKNANQLETDMNVKRTAGRDLLKDSNSWLNKLLGLSSEMLNNAKSVSLEGEKAINKEIELYNAGKKTNEEKQKLVSEINKQIEYNNEVINKLKEQGQSTKEVEKSNDNILKKLWLIRDGIDVDKNETSKWVQQSDKVRTSYDGTVEVLNTINNTKIKDKSATINFDTNTTKAESGLKSFVSKLGNSISSTFEKIFTGKDSWVSKLGSSAKKLFGFKAGGVVKCATGSVINMPGRGVPIGNAIGGEAGAEGIIPLTNSQMMAQLGEAIGKYITINANITNTMNGRVISRELQKVQNDSDFAFNR